MADELDDPKMVADHLRAAAVTAKMYGDDVVINVHRELLERAADHLERLAVIDAGDAFVPDDDVLVVPSRPVEIPVRQLSSSSCVPCSEGRHSACSGDFHPKDWCRCPTCSASPFGHPANNTLS